MAQHVRRLDDPAATKLSQAVLAWLGTLDVSQRATACFPFESAERMVWDYVPGDREGLSLAEMGAVQRAAATAVVRVGLSARGSEQVAAIIALEPILGELERSIGRPGAERRDPERYWFAVFGEPGNERPWSWRIGGHHVAVQLTMAGGRVVAGAPSFLGANPAIVPAGPFAGARALAGEEDLARAFIATLSPVQRRVAVVDPVAPPDILSGSGPRVGRAALDGLPSGIRHDQLEAGQSAALETLIRYYLGRASDDIAAMEWARVVDAGLASVTFAWAGPEMPGLGHYYAIRGPQLLIEYDNTQNGANHIHAVRRDLTNDWGEDLLAAHYGVSHSGAG
jgi:hypothetical protein